MVQLGLVPISIIAVLLLSHPHRSYAQLAASSTTTLVEVQAIAETDPMPNSGDAADDAAIWIHPTDPSRSTIIATNKQGGIAVYDLAGRQLQYLYDGNMNTVDLRYNFPLQGRSVALVAASNRSNNSITAYTVNPATRLLEEVSTIATGFPIYGLCMYHSFVTHDYYIFITSDEGVADRGKVQQWKLSETSDGKVTGTKVRSFDVGSLSEGCVADDELGHLYISEESQGIWRYWAEPQATVERWLVDTTASGGHLTGDVEGLTLYYGSNRTGYLIASSQGSNSFAVYQREPDNTYLTTFIIAAGSVDGVSGTDGIDVTNFGLSSAFPGGAFVAQDNTNNLGNQNFKLVAWDNIATAGGPSIKIDTTRDPRKVAANPPPSPYIFTAGADAHVEEANATINFGTSQTMRVDGDPNLVSESYLRFNVTDVEGVRSARLRLYALSSALDGPTVYATNNDWSENTITWNNRPLPIGNALDSTGAFDAETWIEYDVSSVVKGNGTYSFIIATETGDGATFSSRDGSAPPQLVLTTGYRINLPIAAIKR